MTDSPIPPRSELDDAIYRALESAQLRAGDGATSTGAWVVEPWEVSAAEAGDLDGDGD